MSRNAILLCVLVATAGFIGVLSQGCLIRSLTGVCCPGCGGKRAALQLLEGDWAGAAKSNLLIYPIAAGILWTGVAFATNRPRSSPLHVSRKAMWWLLTAVALFTLLRNLPAAGFLRP